ncbi:MAG: glycosyltransferase [Pseudomonas profundi]|uniref:glycosyltransferase n=1 Tax=Pseudomonas profundi TaxID=1981513 RepID=UPI00300311C5
MDALVVADYDRFGGVAKASNNLVACLSSSGLEVHKYAIHSDPVFCEPKLLNYLRSVRRTWEFRESFQIFMHFEAILIGLILGFITCSFKQKVFVIHTDIYGYYAKSSLLKRFVLAAMMRLLRKRRVVFVSKEAELRAKDFFGLRYTSSIYNVLTESAEGHVFRERGGTTVIGSIARLHKSKNIDLLIRTFDSVCGGLPNYSLKIYGDGPERERLEDYAAQFSSFDRISFMGEESEPRKMFGSIDALVGFSSIEGFALVILEALSKGLPVLHSDCCCGPREIMDPFAEPSEKTSNWIVVSGGILVAPPEESGLYLSSLADNEGVYHQALNCFLSKLESFSHKGLPGAERFYCTHIAQQWRELLATR